MEKYSVLMSVYEKNNSRELIESINSMINQTIVCEQFVLVEDGPIPEELEKVVNLYVNKFPGLFTIVSLVENVGLGRALDEGLKHCHNNLIARMDADDISLPTRCEKLLRLFEQNDNLAIAGTNIDEFYDDPNHIVSSRIVPCDYESIKKFIRRRSPFNHPTVMFKKSEVIRCGGYGKMRRKQDMDLFSRMLNMDCYALNIEESLLLFRAGEDNYIRRKSWEYCKSYIEVIYRNFKRGYCSFCDLIIVVVGQLVLFIAPIKIMKLLSDRFLRSKVSLEKEVKDAHRKCSQ